MPASKCKLQVRYVGILCNVPFGITNCGSVSAQAVNIVKYPLMLAVQGMTNRLVHIHYYSQSHTKREVSAVADLWLTLNSVIQIIWALH